MGLYINPPNQAKEEWLEQRGRKISKAEAREMQDFTGELAVILVDNYAFTAVAVGYSAREIEAFFHPEDFRPKEYWMLPREAICEGAGITMEMLDEATGK